MLAVMLIISNVNTDEFNVCAVAALYGVVFVKC